MLVDEDSVCSYAFKRCKEQGLMAQNVRRWHFPPFRHIVIKVYHCVTSPRKSDRFQSEKSAWALPLTAHAVEESGPYTFGPTSSESERK